MKLIGKPISVPPPEGKAPTLMLMVDAHPALNR